MLIAYNKYKKSPSLSILIALLLTILPLPLHDKPLLLNLLLPPFNLLLPHARRQKLPLIIEHFDGRHPLPNLLADNRQRSRLFRARRNMRDCAPF